MKAKVINLLRHKLRFNCCCVCSKMVSAEHHVSGDIFNIRDVYCAKCKNNMAKGVHKCTSTTLAR